MTDPDQNDPEVRRGQEERLRATWAAPTGWFFRWTDVNNNVVGVWYTLTAFFFMTAVQTGEKEALASLGRDPETTGSIEPKPMKWCGVAPWCR